MTTEAQEVAQRIQRVLPSLKAGTLRFFGDWFGRPFDNVHTITEAAGEDNCLILSFDEGEWLRVWDPTDFVGDAQTFRIAKATKVRWEWFSYGRSRTPEHRYFLEYTVTDNRVVVRSNVDWYTPPTQVSLMAPAVEML